VIIVLAITVSSWRASLAPPWNTKSPKNESLSISISVRTIPATRAIETATAGMNYSEASAKSVFRIHLTRLPIPLPP